MDASTLEFVNQQNLWVFCATSLRMGPIFWFAPPFNSPALPARIRLLLTMALSLVLTPIALRHAPGIGSNTLHIVFAAAMELLLGVLLCGIFALTVTSLQLAGNMAGSMAGLSGFTGSSLDQELRSPLSNIFTWISIGFLLVLGAHRLLMQCCLESLTTQPVGTLQFHNHWFAELEYTLRHAFIVGIKAGATLAAILLTTNFTLGFLARAVPQLNVFSIGFSANALSVLAVLFLTVGGIGSLYESELVHWIDSCRQVISSDP